jgi:3-keto-disaccharide hydrolase
VLLRIAERELQELVVVLDDRGEIREIGQLGHIEACVHGETLTAVARKRRERIRQEEEVVRTSTIIPAVLVMAAGSTAIVNFDSEAAGKPPSGWTATQTGSGRAQWAVVPDDSAPSKPNVLKQSGQAAYPVCIKDDTSIKDGSVEVKFKPISGREDQAGGVIWRAKDANNYYVARANALESNVTIYHTVDGRRTEKKRANMKVATNEWHTLHVEFQGSHFVVRLDGKDALAWDDETFKDAGKVGVWTKADSVTLFDDFSYSSK